MNLLSSDDIEDYFNQINFKIKKIYWINDFSCIVEFDNEEQALECFKILTGLEIDKDAQDIHKFDWKVSKPFIINDTAHEIQVRVSEVKDLDKKSGKGDSVYYKVYSQRIKNNYKSDYYYKQRNVNY